MIIYFSGTGNSKYIAYVLSKKLNDETVDAAALIKADKTPEFNSEKPFVFVSPIYAWRLPRIFQNWIEKCNFIGTKKAYFVITCGDSIGAADNYVKRFAQNKGFDYMGTQEVVMPENYIVMFKAPSEEKIAKLIENGTKTAECSAEKIKAAEPLLKKKSTLLGNLESNIVTPFFYKFYIGAKKFYANDKCISCGKCQDVCICNNISLKEGKPIWDKNCTHCMACISKCPAFAIEYGKNTVGKKRYTCPKEK